MHIEGMTTYETVCSVAILVVFIIGCYVVGRVVNSFTAMRSKQDLAPLAPLIQGTISNGVMTGTYQGLALLVKVERNSYVTGMGNSVTPMRDSERYNALEIEVKGLPGHYDWKGVYVTHSFGPQGYQVVADDPALQEKLKQADVIAAVSHVRGSLRAAYTTYNQTLFYGANISPRNAPSSQEFKAQLELLLWLAKLNEQVNAA